MEKEQKLVLEQSYKEWRQDVNNALKEIRYHAYDVEELAKSTEKLLSLADKLSKI